MGKFSRCVALAAIAGLSLAAANRAEAVTLLKVGGQSVFIRGVNLAWLDGNYGTDIGVNPIHPDWGVHYNSAHMNQYLADMKNMGANVVRIWLFENMQGLKIDSSKHVTGLDSTFLTNLDNIVALARQNGIHPYFTLLNDTMGDGYLNTITDSASRTAYINNAVKPLVTRYKGDATIFAFDIENECESQIAGSSGNWGTSGTDWTTMRTFISACASAVHGADSTRLVTCTSGWHSWSNLQAGHFSGLGLDFYDCHVYDDNGALPAASSLNLDKPVICGEFGQSTSSWNDSIQNSCISKLVPNAINNGWAGVAYWDYEFPGSTDYLAMLNSNGSWRPGVTTLKNFYVASIDGDGGPNGGGGGGTATTIYDFENSLNGWVGSGMSGGPWSANDWAVSGTYSLKEDVNLASAANFSLLTNAANNFSGKTQLTATVRHAAWGNYPGGMTAKLYIQTGTGWTWYDGGTVAIGTGNTVLTLNLSGVANLNLVKAVGVQFTAGTGDTGASSVYVDKVTLQ